MPYVGLLNESQAQRGGYWDEGTGRGRSLLRPSSIAVPNVTAYLSTASVPITVLLYGSLLCSFNVPVKELRTIVASYVMRLRGLVALTFELFS